MSSPVAVLELDEFGAWLARTAEANDTSQETLLRELMSSYWLIDELARFISDDGIDRPISTDGPPSQDAEPLDPQTSQDGTPNAPKKEDAPPASSLDPALVDLVRALTSPDHHSASNTQDLIDLINALAAFSKQQTTTDDRHRGELAGEIRSLARAVATLEPALDGVTEELAQAAHERTATIESSRRDFDALRAELDGLAATATATRADIDRLTDHVSGIESDLIRRLGALESDVAGDTKRIRTVLEHLVDRTDELRAETAAVTDISEGLHRLNQEADARQRASDLRIEANRAGIETATCEACRERVIIGLLDRPHCPHCETAFGELATSGGWIRRSYSLTKAADATTARTDQPIKTGVLPTLRDIEADRSDQRFYHGAIRSR